MFETFLILIPQKLKMCSHRNHRESVVVILNVVSILKHFSG